MHAIILYAIKFYLIKLLLMDGAGVGFQEEVEVEGGIGNSMMNPDDFLSINLDDDDNNINAFKDSISSSSSSSSSSTTSPPENNIRLLFPTHHDNGKSAPPNPNYYHCYYYNNNNNNNIAPQGGALLGSTKSPPSCTRKENPMHCHDHDHTYMAAAPPFAFASNQWSNGKSVSFQVLSTDTKLFEDAH